MGVLHAGNLTRRVGCAEVGWVIDTAAERAEQTACELGSAWTTDLDRALEDPTVEGVLLATPTNLHAEMVERSLAAGKHVFCEKPLTLELETTLRLIDQADAAGLVLQVGFHRRFDPDWLAMARWSEAGELGQALIFRASQRDMVAPESTEFLASFGGLFVDAVIHDLDCARWLVGEVNEVQAHGASLSSPTYGELGDADNALVVLHFACGALGVIDYSRTAGYGYECSAEILGARGTIRLGANQQSHDVRWLRHGVQSVDHPLDHQHRHAAAYLAEVEHFAEAIQGSPPAGATGEDVVQAFVLAQASARSLLAGHPVRVESGSREREAAS